MWFPFWRSRNRFSLDELRFLIDQLQKTQTITEVNKEFVVEALRSIAEIITYGDQHDPSFFEFFMEKQVMGEFVRLLRISKTVTVSVQLLQTMSIMIQNLKSEHAIYYIFSNEHINYLITYTFDFRHDELLSYYISFLRAISGKLNKNTISLLVKTENDVVVSFPLYVEAIQFAFHEENMIRTAVRALTLNVYHVGDESVNNFVASPPQAEYFSNLVLFFHKQCLELSGLVSAVQKVPSLDSTSKLLSVIDEIEDNLYYFSDVVSAGIPDVGRLITDQILQHLILPLVLPSLCSESVNDVLIGSVTSLYLLCCILRIVKIKDLANTTAAAFFCPLHAFISSSEAKNNAHVAPNSLLSVSQHQDNRIVSKEDTRSLGIALSSAAGNFQALNEEFAKICFSSSHLTLREILLSYMTKGNDVQALGSLFVLATLLQTKELEESMLDAFGILPQRKKHKKLLLQALVGEGSGEEQLFSSNNGIIKDGLSNELGVYLLRLEEQFGLSILEVGSSPRVHRNQVVDALVSLLCRASISAETLWDGGWLLRQLLPYSESEFNCHHFEMLKVSYVKRTNDLMLEIRGTWADLLITVLLDEWKKCKRVIEAPSPRKEPKSILLQLYKCDSEDTVASASSFAAGERMCELVKVFVILHQLQMFSLGKPLPEQPPILRPTDIAETSRAARAGLDVSSFKPGAEVRLVDGVPCRIAFERGKERHFSFLALSVDVSGWIILVEESPLKQNYGVLRVAAPLAGCNPRIDEKHRRWLNLKIRPSTLPVMDPAKRGAYSKLKPNNLVDGRWTLAFRDEESCQSALSMVLEEMDLQSMKVEKRIKPLLQLEIPQHQPDLSSSS